MLLHRCTYLVHHTVKACCWMFVKTLLTKYPMENLIYLQMFLTGPYSHSLATEHRMISMLDGLCPATIFRFDDWKMNQNDCICWMCFWSLVWAVRFWGPSESVQTSSATVISCWRFAVQLRHLSSETMYKTKSSFGFIQLALHVNEWSWILSNCSSLNRETHFLFRARAMAMRGVGTSLVFCCFCFFLCVYYFTLQVCWFSNSC